jgi:hypothetical protein
LADASKQQHQRRGSKHNTGQQAQQRFQRWRPGQLQQELAGGSGSRSSSGRTSTPARDSTEASMQRTASIMAAQSPEHLLGLIQQHDALLDKYNVSASFTRAKALCCGAAGSPLQGAAVQQVLQVLPRLAERVQRHCGERQLANIIWACGYLQLRAVIDLLMPLFVQRCTLQAAKPQHLANALYGAAKAGVKLSEGNIQLLLTAFSTVLAEVDSQHVSNSLWAVATMQQRVPAYLLQLIMDRFTELLPDAVPQHVSNTLSAVATIRLPMSAQQLQLMLSRLSQLLPSAKPQHISNTLWAVATMGLVMPAQQMRACLERQMQLLQSATTQDIKDILWAVATMQQLQRRLGQQVLARQEVAALLGAFISSFTWQARSTSQTWCGPAASCCSTQSSCC